MLAFAPLRFAPALRCAPNAYQGDPPWPRPMPAKGMCPNCGHKMRGPSHLCDPTKVQRERARHAALAKIQSK